MSNHWRTRGDHGSAFYLRQQPAVLFSIGRGLPVLPVVSTASTCGGLGSRPRTGQRADGAYERGDAHARVQRGVGGGGTAPPGPGSGLTSTSPGNFDRYR